MRKNNPKDKQCEVIIFIIFIVIIKKINIKIKFIVLPISPPVSIPP